VDSSTRRLTIGNQKGGVGKTATVLGLASALMKRKKQVLVVDMDPQANSTTGLGVEVPEDHLTTYELMSSTSPGAARDAVMSTPWDGVDLIPASVALSRIESDGSNDLIFRLDTAFEGLDLSDYAAMLIDCPPSLGKLLYSSLCASDGVAVVTQAERDSVNGVQAFIETVENVRRRPNPKLTLDKIIINLRDNNNEHVFREEELRTKFGDLVAKTTIPDLVARKNAHSVNMPIHEYRGRGNIPLQVAYDSLLEELIPNNDLKPIGAPA
jgi:chromosome partitioning protein